MPILKNNRLSTAIRNKLISARKFITQTPGIIKPISTNKKLVSLVVPAGGIASGGAGILRSAVGGAKTIFTRATSNPFAGATGVKSFAKIAGARAAGVATTAAGGAAIYSAITNQPYSLSLKKVGLGAAGFGIGGYPGLAAGLFGSGIFGAGRAVEKISQSTRAINPFVDERPDRIVFPNMPESKFNFMFPEPQALPSGLGGSVAFAPSISAAAGGGGSEFAILALLAGLGGGFLLGRRKRKKKQKYKKRRRRK